MSGTKMTREHQFAQLFATSNTIQDDEHSNAKARLNIDSTQHQQCITALRTQRPRYIIALRTFSQLCQYIRSDSFRDCGAQG